MTNHRFIVPAAMLFAMACAAAAQGGGSDTVERLGLDISGIERGKVATAVGVAPVGKAEKRPKGPTEITAHEAMFDSKEYLATFNTEVRVTDPEFGLVCDRLTVNLKRPAAQGAAKPAEKKPVTGAGNGAAKADGKGDSNSGIDKAFAEGNVIITQEKKEVGRETEHYEGRGKRAIFDNKTGTLTLYGRPRIAQGVIRGEDVIILKDIVTLEESGVITIHRAGKIEVKGLFKSTLHDAADLNQKPR